MLIYELNSIPNLFIVLWRINICETEALHPAAIHFKWLSSKHGATTHQWSYIINKERLHSKCPLSINQFPCTLKRRLLAAVSATCSTSLQLSKKFNVKTHIGTAFSQMFNTCACFLTFSCKGNHAWITKNTNMIRMSVVHITCMS
jgi:hypothetical protein